MANINITEFNSELMKICTSYVSAIGKEMEQASDQAAEFAVDKLRKTSPRGDTRTNHYADDWKKKKSRGGAQITNTVYNKQYPLTHLLENGHELRRGGRSIGESPPLPHIDKVAEEAKAMYERKAKETITDVQNRADD